MQSPSTRLLALSAAAVLFAFPGSNLSSASDSSPVIRVSIDRTDGDWSDLAMGPPSGDDDADQSRNARAVVSFIPTYGVPDPEAGAVGLTLPRLNDGKAPENDDDHANSVWFDTAGSSRILMDLGSSMDIRRINVYSWHAGALAPQQYRLWASDREKPEANVESLSRDWQFVAAVDTRSLGDGGKHGSSINVNSGTMLRCRYLLFDLPANKPEWKRSGFLSEIDVYQVGRTLPAVQVQKRQPSMQTLKFGPISISKPLNRQTSFLAAGQKIYEFGAMDGTFPRVGRDGEQGGIWRHPIKLLDRFEYRVLEPSLPPIKLQGANRFTHDFASSEFQWVRNELKITRRDFAAENEPALFSSVTLRNNAMKTRTLELEFAGKVRLRPCWGCGLPDQGRPVLAYEGGLVTAFDSAMKGRWAVAFGGDRLPSQQVIDGDSASLAYRVTLPPGGATTLTFLIVGENEKGVEPARQTFYRLRQRAPELLADKIQTYRNRTLGGVKFECSDKAISDAFYCAKANIQMSVMDLRPYFIAPYLAAGFPIYPWLFGCDSCYSTPGAAAAGFRDAARGTLECLLHDAARAGRGAHEIVPNGRVLGTDHVQETPQLVGAVWEHFLWTGDREFLKTAFPVCRDILEQVLKTSDADHDGYLEGPGLMEQPGMGPERLDSVCYLYSAYGCLARMTETLGQPGAATYRDRAAELKLRFNRDWWNANETMWACSLRSDHTQTMDNFWVVIFPQQVGIADLEKARAAMNRIEREWVNAEWGCVAQWDRDIRGRGVGVVHNNECALTAFRFGRADLGAKLLQLSAMAPMQERLLGGFDETLPGGGDLIQLWSFAPYLEAVIGGLVGVHPNAAAHAVEIYPQMPASLSSYHATDIAVGAHRLNVGWQRKGAVDVVNISQSFGPSKLDVLLRVGGTSKEFLLNGKPIQTSPEFLNGVATATIRFSLAPGNQVTLRRIR